MSLTFGIWSRNGKPIPNAWQNRLWQRGTCEHLGISWIDARFSIQKIDIGAFAPGWSQTDTHITALAGDAILTSGVRDRADDLRAIESGELEPLLMRSRGYFNLARYNRRTGDLTLAVDRLGMRCLYVYDDGDFVIFSGALRILEKLEGITLTMDCTGVLQEAAFGFPLGERTRYLEVACLQGGTIWRNGVKSRYWEWQPRERDPQSGMDEMHATFQEAVTLRRGNRTKVFAGLSGGLDSRCVATELWRQGAEIDSLNVSWQGSYDEILGGAYAKQLGFKHRYSQRPMNDSGNTLAAQLWKLSGRSTQIWGGTDGSLSVGHTKMTRKSIEKLRARDKEGAAREFLRASGIALSGALLKGRWSTLAGNLPLQSVLDELPDCHDRSLWFFRLRNQHRRVLAFHFEQIDTVAFECIEPLADPEFLLAIASVPIDYCLAHGMYYEWLKRFPAQIMSVAWQAYPASLPCPVALPDGYTQWAAPTQSSRSRMRSLRSACEQMSKERNDFLSRGRVALAYLLHGLGRDTSHLLRQAELINGATSAPVPRVHESVARRVAQLVPPA